MKKAKRILSLLLVIAVVLSVMIQPKVGTAFAEEVASIEKQGTDAEGVLSTENQEKTVASTISTANQEKETAVPSTQKQEVTTGSTISTANQKKGTVEAFTQKQETTTRSTISTANQKKETVETSTQKQEVATGSTISTADQNKTSFSTADQNKGRTASTTSTDSVQATSQTADLRAKTQNQNLQIELEDAAVVNEDSGQDSVQSLLPLMEPDVTLVLSGLSEEDIKNMTVRKMLDMIQDQNGERYPYDKEITEDTKVVWTYNKDQNGEIITDDYVVKSLDDKIDLPLPSENPNLRDYTMQFIIDDGKQLNTSNVRYRMKIYLSDKITEQRTYDICTKVNRVHPKIKNVEKTKNVNSEVITYVIDSGFNASKFYLSVSSLAIQHPNIDVRVYEKGKTNPITGDILNIDLNGETEAYEIKLNETKHFIFKYINRTTGKTIAEQESIFKVRKSTDSSISSVEEGLWEYKEDEETKKGEMSQVFVAKENSVYDSYIHQNGGAGVEEVQGENELTYILKQKYDVATEYYCTLKPEGTFNAENIEKAVVGKYSSREEIETQEDIKDALFPTDLEEVPYGYKADYSQGVDFTIISKDGDITWYNIKTVEYDAKYETDYVEKYEGVPIIGEKDPWFRVTGAGFIEATENGKSTVRKLNTYVIENGKAIDMDTMYAYGRQTIVINSDNKNLKWTKIVPIFECENASVKLTHINGKSYKKDATLGYYLGLEEDDAQTEQKKKEFNNNEAITVRFSVAIPSEEDSSKTEKKYYNVTFTKKYIDGAKLFIPGTKIYPPQNKNKEQNPKLEVFLDEYFEEKHDVLLMNIGNQPLKNLRAELQNAKNVKIDSYWTIGGENNDELSEFDLKELKQLQDSDMIYGQLSNMAKIRLVPAEDDNTGIVSGDLVLYSGDQEIMRVELTGSAIDPVITTDTSDMESAAAVKYVPYSYAILTSNMHTWCKETFSIVEGEEGTGSLPEGLELIEETGEIYGVPLEEGEFPITVRADFKSDTYYFPSVTKDLVLTVKTNENKTVYNASSGEEYKLLESIGKDNNEDRDFILEVEKGKEFSDELFRSNGKFATFDVKDIGAVYLNGVKLARDVDYIAEEGSTKITILKKTFENEELVNKDGTNTIAAEFRVDGDRNKELKCTAQNFRIKVVTPSNTVNTSNQGNSSNNNQNNNGINRTNNNGTNNNGISSNGTSSSQSTTRRVIQTSTTATSKSSQTVKVDPNAVTCTIHLVDANNKILTGVPLELHSTVKKMTTSKKGLATFQNIDFGKHTLYVKKDTTVSKAFEIVAGDTLKLDNDKITVPKGTIFTLKVQYDGKKLTLLSVQSGSEDDIKTGDDSNFEFWTFVCILSIAGIGIIIAGRMKNKLNIKHK